MDKARRPCHGCHGQGRYLTMGEFTCTACCGTGRQGGMVIRIGCPPCPVCNGRGRKAETKYVRCEQCNGSGYNSY